MRIISGKFKGRKLKAPDDLSIRPTLDRVKESIFNVLGNRLKDARVLDLFSGTGSLGLESLSRGAGFIYFVDKDIQSINLIRYNTESLISNKDDIRQFELIQKDVASFLRFCNDKKWDIIFLDPPYRIEAEKMKDIFDVISGNGIAGNDTILVYEFFFKRDVSGEIGNFNIVKESFFGDKKVIYLQLDETKQGNLRETIDG